MRTPSSSSMMVQSVSNFSVLLTICSVISYPLSIINVFVSAGLIHLYLNPFSAHRNPQKWTPPFRATLPIVIFFFLSSVYLVVAPFVPPSAEQNVYESLPYYLHFVVGLGIILAGAVYYVFWALLLPKLGGYELAMESSIGSDGWPSNVFSRRPRVTRRGDGGQEEIS